MIKVLLKSRTFKLGLIILILTLAGVICLNLPEYTYRASLAKEQMRIEIQNKFRSLISFQLGPSFQKNEFPAEAILKVDDQDLNLQVKYTLDAGLQESANKLLKQYKPDYGAIVMMDAMSGAILTLASFEKNSSNETNLSLRGTYPAASIFKIITASAAVDRRNLTPDTIVLFNGANHTLYKQNVLKVKQNRWTREVSLKDAFAKSINTFFGRMTLEYLNPKDLEDYSIRFGYNRLIQSDLPFDMGFTNIPKEKSYALAEIASGFNRITRMSPVQGAMIAASVAAHGTMPIPYIVQELNDHAGNSVFKSETVTAGQTMTPRGAERLRELMEATLYRGTSRSAFRPLTRNKKFDELELGGKTGSLFGDNPKGKVDWFVGYAIAGPKEKIAIATITVNREYWTVKSSYLAQSMIQKHFKAQFTEGNKKFFQASTSAAQGKKQGESN